MNWVKRFVMYGAFLILWYKIRGLGNYPGGRHILLLAALGEWEKSHTFFWISKLLLNFSMMFPAMWLSNDSSIAQNVSTFLPLSDYRTTHIWMWCEVFPPRCRNLEVVWFVEARPILALMPVIGWRDIIEVKMCKYCNLWSATLYDVRRDGFCASAQAAGGHGKKESIECIYYMRRKITHIHNLNPCHQARACPLLVSTPERQ